MKTKTKEEYAEDLLRIEDLIETNLTRLSKTVARIQKLREKGRYVSKCIDLLKKNVSTCPRKKT